jgi:Cu(I)/Ag(I) efflux system membrane fusion protein
VVVRGAFALDADLQIRGGDSMMTQPDDTMHGQWDGIVKISAAARKSLRPAIEGYIDVQKALAEDDLEAAKKAASALLRRLDQVRIPQPVDAVKLWREISSSARKDAGSIAKASDIEDARGKFEGLSSAVLRVVRTFGNPLDDSLVLAHCPMAFGSRGASWLQEKGEIDNSYFGAQMRTCGEVQADVAPGSYLPAPDSDTEASDQAGGQPH